MWMFAWRNLLTRPTRTILGLIGLAVPILGFIGLFSISHGMRNMVGETLDQIQGVMVLRENVLSPVFSDVSMDDVRRIRELPESGPVAPEIWKIALSIDGKFQFLPRGGAAGGAAQSSIFNTVVVCGQDIPGHAELKSAVYPRHIERDGGGRFLQPSDAGTNNVVISRWIARTYPRPDGSEKQVGDVIRIGAEDFNIVGIYDCRSMLLDVVIVMDIDTCRRLFKIDENMVSSVYVEAAPGHDSERLAAAIEESVPGVDARAMSEFLDIFGMLMENFDGFLIGVVALALVVGVVGIVNTMLMSTTERFGEFGVLRTNGWSRWNVLTLVTVESGFLGLLSGIVGAVLALVGIAVANVFLANGLQLDAPPRLVASAIAVSVAVAVLGGLYPAAKAARMPPMEAIRAGSR